MNKSQKNDLFKPIEDVFSGGKHMKELGNAIYRWGCVVAATILGVGVADYWLGQGRLIVFLSWVVIAAIPWLVGRVSLYVLAREFAG
jgi:hypothetical protein